MAHYDMGQHDLSRKYIDRVLNVLPMVRSWRLKMEVYCSAALVYSCLASDSMDQQMILAYLECAFQACAQCSYDSMDDNFFRGGRRLLLFYKAWVLSAPHMRVLSGESVQDILSDARRLTDSQWVRQHISLEFLLALAHFARGSYQESVDAALLALEKSVEIRSQLNRNRIEGLYQRIVQTSYRNRRPFPTSCATSFTQAQKGDRNDP